MHNEDDNDDDDDDDADDDDDDDNDDDDDVYFNSGMACNTLPPGSSTARNDPCSMWLLLYVFILEMEQALIDTITFTVYCFHNPTQELFVQACLLGAVLP